MVELTSPIFYQRHDTPEFILSPDEAARKVNPSEDAYLYGPQPPNTFTSLVDFSSEYLELEFLDVVACSPESERLLKRKRSEETDDELPPRKRRKTSSEDEPKKASSKKRKRGDEDDGDNSGEDARPGSSKKSRAWYKYQAIPDGGPFLWARGYFADGDRPMELHEIKDEVDAVDNLVNPNRDSRDKDRGVFLKRLYNSLVHRERHLLQTTVTAIAGEEEAKRFMEARKEKSKFKAWGALLPYGRWFPVVSSEQEEISRERPDTRGINSKNENPLKNAVKPQTQRGFWVLAPKYAAPTAYPE